MESVWELAALGSIYTKRQVNVKLIVISNLRATSKQTPARSRREKE